MSNSAAHLEWASAVECYTEPHWYFVFCFCLMWITVLINSGIMLVSIREMKIKTTGTKAENNFKRAYLFILGLFIIGCLGYPVGIAVSIGCVFPGEFLKYQAIVLVGLCFNFFGLSFLYLFTLYRLKVVFENTPFQLSRIVLVVLLLGFAVQIVSTIFSTYYFLAESWPWPKGLRWYTIYLYTNIAGGLITVSLFFRKIVQLTRLSRDAETADNKKQGPRSKNNKLLFLGIRYLVLGLIALLSTSVGDVIGMYRVDVEDHMFLFITNITYMCIDAVVNGICLALQFKFGEAQYYKYCRCCDHLCRVCVAKILHIDLTDKNNQFILETGAGSKLTAEFSFTTHRPAVVAQRNLAAVVQQDAQERAGSGTSTGGTIASDASAYYAAETTNDEKVVYSQPDAQMATSTRNNESVTMMKVGNTDQVAVLH